MILDLSGKAAIVTGAASGIGQAISVKLAQNGADVWLIDRDADGLVGTSKRIIEKGGKAPQAITLDLRSRGGLARLVSAVAEAHPYLFALINNAGIMHPEPILRGTAERWAAMFDVNVLAVLEGSQSAVHAMRAHGRPGHVINMGSVASRFEAPGVYGATKLAVEAIGNSLRAELEGDDIRIATIIPGGFATQLGRGFLPDQLAFVEEQVKAYTVQFGALRQSQMVGDPEHIANVVAYILAQDIDVNIQEIVIRPPLNPKPA